MHIGADLGVHHHPQPEHARKHDAHHRVLLDAAVGVQKPGGQRADHARAKGPDDQRECSAI